MQDDPWLTVEQIAKRVQLHPDTIRRFLREGKINGNLISRRAGWRVKASEADRFITGGEFRAVIDEESKERG